MRPTKLLRLSSPPPSLMFRAAIVAASVGLVASCTSSTANDSGLGAPDAGEEDSGLADTGLPPDAGPPDTGPPPCLRDQGGETNRGCDPGEVCNLAMSPAQCVAGRSCTTDTDCNVCSALQDPQDCGHGFNVVAFCDTRHGNVCTRGRAPCEPCTEDRDCGGLHPALGQSTPSKCLDYGSGESYCGRTCTLGCPSGFTCDGVSGQCKRVAGCEADTSICPAGPPNNPNCTGTDQICEGEECPGTGGARCSTNDLIGALGTCMGFCTENADCPSDLPVCNPRNGICIRGCEQGSCAGGQVCHLDHFCGPPCADNANCATRFGADAYCNRAGQPAPNIYKGHRDPSSCAPKGCEKPVDCPSPDEICDDNVAPPACVRGCYDEQDCLSGFVCKSTSGQPQRPSYNRGECRALALKTDPDEIGVCCNPGCTKAVLQCNINEWCCGEIGSPYENPASCLTLTATGAMAQAGECFDMAVIPWCVTCDGSVPCSSGWTAGFNVDSNISSGQPFQEQEFCSGIAMGLNICAVTCNPEPSVPGRTCPRGWECGPVWAPCFQDADCNGLACLGADAANMRPGKCQCGTNNAATAACPSTYGNFPTVDHPRCVASGPNPPGDMFCLAAYNCKPPGLRAAPPNYPASCGF